MSSKTITRTVLSISAVSLGAGILAACGSSGSSSTSSAGATAGGGTAVVASSGLTTRSTSIGTVAADAAGHTLYELVGDTTSNSKCTGSCLAAWPAVKAHGRQVVLQGHPAYTFAGDNAPGQVTGEGVKDQWGTWYALDKDGKPITTSASATSPSAAASTGGTGGGYGY